MKKNLLFVVVFGIVAGSALAQYFPDPAVERDPTVHTQSLSFSGAAAWVPGTTTTVDVSLTYAGYSSFGFSYWVQLPIALAPFVSVVDVHYFTFPNSNQGPQFGSQFNDPSGASPGNLLLPRDLGATVEAIPPSNALPPGTYPITRLTFALSASTPFSNGQSFTMSSTTEIPRASEVGDTDFNDNNIPAALFVINIVPEPSTPALLGLAGLGSVLVVSCRRRRS